MYFVMFIYSSDYVHSQCIVHYECHYGFSLVLLTLDTLNLTLLEHNWTFSDI